jgi:hypothetical protein
MTSKLDDRFAERHHEVSSGTVIAQRHPRSGHHEVSSAKRSSRSVIREAVITKCHPSKKVNVSPVFFQKSFA